VITSCGLLLVQNATAVTHYYVATTGNDSNNGSRSNSAWRTITHASKALHLDPTGVIVHVAPGTYNEDVYTSRSGTPNARITYISDRKWGAKIVPLDTPVFAWTNYGNYTNIENFDIGGKQCGGIGNQASHQTALGNNVHNAADGCDTGANGGSGINDANYAGVNNQIIGNFVHDVGVSDPLCGRPGHNIVHGIYHSHYGGFIANNVLINNCAFGIHLWHAASHTVVVNNTAVGNHLGGIIIGAGDAPCTTTGCTGDDYTFVINNIVVFNGGWGISEEGLTGPHNRYLNNLAFSNKSGDFSLLNGLRCSECITGKEPRFVRNTRNAEGDYHLRPNSPAVHAGVKTHAPASDYDGLTRTPPITIGAYQLRKLRD
jgi:hypothetical protein